VTSELEDLQQIGQLLKAARKELGYSQQKVAELAGISRLRYHDIEAGRSAARITTMMSIARAMGLEMMFVPRVWVPAVNGLLRPHDIVDDAPLDDGDTFTFEGDLTSE
jgi:DNA-binding XRE family transcriptional regulator